MSASTGGSTCRGALTTKPGPTQDMLEIRSTQHGGRAYFSTHPIARGTLLLAEGPAISTIYSDFRLEVCCHCFRYDNGRTLKIRAGASSRACSEACALLYLELHPRESQLLDQLTASKNCLGADADTFIDLLRFALSALAMSSSSSSALYAEVLSLQNAAPLLTPLELASQASATAALQRLFPAAIIAAPAELIAAIQSRSKVNCFGLWEQLPDSTTTFPESEMLGYAIYPRSSYFNHSCAPNVAKARVGREMRFFALRNLEGGEEAAISYLGDREFANREERRNALREWGFECACKRCEEEEKEEGA